jgi:predicted amidohydrolase
MLLPGYALMALGTQIHIATWPFSSRLDPVLNKSPLISQAFACQGSCYVIATGALFRPEDVEETYRDLAVSRVDGWIGDRQGGCSIIDPVGDAIAKAAAGEETVLTASVSLEPVLNSKGFLDVGSHYSRPDVLQLLVNRRPLERIVETSSIDQAIVNIRDDDPPDDSAKGS